MIKRHCSDINALLRCKKAQAMVEYSLILAFVFIIALCFYYNITIDEKGREELHSFVLSIKDAIYRISNLLKHVSI